jgi:hypothetical protein
MARKTFRAFGYDVSVGITIAAVMLLVAAICGSITGWLKIAVIESWAFMYSDVTAKGWMLALLFLGPLAAILIGYILKQKSSYDPNGLFEKDEVFGIIWKYEYEDFAAPKPLCPICKHELELFPVQLDKFYKLLFYRCPKDGCDFIQSTNERGEIVYLDKVEAELDRRQEAGVNSAMQRKKRILVLRKALKGRNADIYFEEQVAFAKKLLDPPPPPPRGYYVTNQDVREIKRN